jgi:chromosome segregation ATPase
MRGNFLLVMIIGVAVTSCATSSDPRQGGLFGYLAHSDEYEARLQERRQLLDNQKNINQDLTDESKALDYKASKQSADIASERERLSSLEGEISRLESDVEVLQAKSVKQKSEITDLKKKIAKQKNRIRSQQIALNELDRSGGSAKDPEKLKVLQQERNRLAAEYKKLSEYSRALANAAR